MKITDVTLELFSWDGVPNVRYGAHSPGVASHKACLGLLTISTDQGLQGHAFLGSSSRSAELDGYSLIAALKPVILGKDPLDREKLNKLLFQRFRMTTYRCIGAVDVALWDIAGKCANLPIYQLMGAARTRIPAYASSMAFDGAAAYIDDALAIQAQNWAAYKIHPPARRQEDIAICRAVRKAVGDDYLLMLDSTWGYSYEDAIRVGREIQDLGFYWYEDPLAEDDIFNYVKLKQHLHIPMVATEHSPGGLSSYAPWIIHQATDVLRGDVAIKGGLTACLKAAHLAEAFHMNYEIHHGGNSLNNVANLHLICAIANSEFFEVLLPAAAHKYGLVEDIEIDKDGYVHVPTGPGLGVEIDFAAITKGRIALLT
ncbi:MAG TPA: enolase C-terminal domain-like protein [Bauldia sp.]|nr:enolase C-terminal domain-like protein [Bauldia sp.]